MDIGFSRWVRRDSADRNALGEAALEYCRALRAEKGVSDARYYWSGVDELSVLMWVESADVAYRLGSGRWARATHALSDLARQTASEVWLDAHVGTAMYKAAAQD